MMDIQKKKKIFFYGTAHNGPVREIAMISSVPDIFVTCGCDNNISKFDLRKRTMVQQWEQPHPVSSIFVSSCGLYCVTGNLKGDVTSFDFRNMKEPLNSVRAHNGAVTRVAFIPSASGTISTFDQKANFNSADLVTPLAPPRKEQPNSFESFVNFIDICHRDNQPQTVIKAPKNTFAGWTDLRPKQRFTDDSLDSVVCSPLSDSFYETPIARRGQANFSLLSADANFRTEEAKSQHSHSEDEEMMTPKVPMILVHPPNDAAHLNGNENGGVKEKSPELLIDFDNSIKSPMSNEPTSNGNGHETDAPDTEAQFIKKLEAQQQSTPNAMVCRNCGHSDISVVNVEELFESMFAETLEQQLNEQSELINNKIRNTMANIQRRVCDRVHEMANDIKYWQYHYNHIDFNGRFNLFERLEQRLNSHEEAIAALLHADTIEDRKRQLLAENENLLKKLG